MATAQVWRGRVRDRRPLRATPRRPRREGPDSGPHVRRVLSPAQLDELADRELDGGIVDDDDVPGLLVAATRCEAGVVEDVVQHRVGDGAIGKVADGSHRAHQLEHSLPRAVRLGHGVLQS